MKRQSLLTTFVLSLYVAQSLSGCAQTTRQADDNLAEEVAALKQEQAVIREELAAIRKSLEQGQRAPAPSGPNVAGKVFDVGDNPVRGSAAAKVVLIEFTDYQCPYCRRHSLQTQPEVEKNYVDTGKVRFVSLDMPIASLHPLAFKAAEAAHCANEQGKYWAMRERLFANQRALEPWSAHAEALGLDVASFGACMNSGQHADGIRRDMAEASRAGATGTPSFVVGIADDKNPGKVRGLTFLRGAKSYQSFRQALDAALASAASGQGL